MSAETGNRSRDSRDHRPEPERWQPAAESATIPISDQSHPDHFQTAEQSSMAGKKIIMRTGEALAEADEAWSAAEPEVVIGELDGPVGYAIANLIGDQVKGHTRVWAILNSDVQVRPATLMVSKYTAPNARYTNILMGTVQAAVANAVLDSVREGHIPKNKVNDIGIIVAVWLDPSAAEAKTKIDHEVLFKTHREATLNAIRKAMNNEPSIDWLLKNQKKVGHYFHELALKGEL
jgi:formaldehyde-activating enzyme